MNFCPVLYSLGIFPARGGWCVRLPKGDVYLQVAAEYMHLLQLWCDGRTPLTEVRERAAKHWNVGSGSDELPAKEALSEFFSFMDALLDAEVLVDAAQLLRHTQILAHNPNDWGKSVAAEKFSLLRTQLNSQADAGHDAHWLGDSSSLAPSDWAGLIEGRHSCYGFSHLPLSRTELLALLACYGVTRDSAEGGEFRRAVPSAGALYRLNLTMVFLRPLSPDLPPGVWRVEYFESGAIALKRLDRENPRLLAAAYRACLMPEHLDGASVWLLISGDLATISAKYRNRAISHAYLEAGAVLQNLGLIASQLGLGQLPMSAFDDERAIKLFELGDDAPLISVVLGQRAAVETVLHPKPQVRWGEAQLDLPHNFAIARSMRDGSFDDASGMASSVACFGKDTDALKAYQKAVCEAVERETLTCRPSAVRWASMAALHKEGIDAIDPRHVLRFADDQYADPKFPLRGFDAEAIYPWVPMQEITCKTQTWMLADFTVRRAAIGEEFRFPSPVAQQYAHVSSSGCAASPNTGYALQNALLELIERDAFMRFWLTRQGAVSLNIQAIAQLKPFSETVSLAKRMTLAGCRVTLLQLATCWAKVVLSVVQHPERHFTLIGAGGAWTIEAAASKAMDEISTSVFAHLTGLDTPTITPDQVRFPVDHLHLYCQEEYFQRADFLFGIPDSSPMPDAATGNRATPTNTTSLLAALSAAGQKAHVSWHPTAELVRDYKNRPIHVVRVIAPGLIPLTFGVGLMPLGMGVELHSGWDDFPHPFP